MTIWPALNTKFAVCQDRAHGELTIVRRVPKPGAHSEPKYFVVCQSQGAHGEPKYFAVCQSQGHTGKWEILSCASFLAHGEVLRHAVRPAASRRLAFFFAVCPWIHTANVFVVCATDGTRQTRPLPCLALPSGVRRRPLTAKSLPCAPPCVWGTRPIREFR